MVAVDEEVVRQYTNLSPDAESIRAMSYRWGGRRRARSASDYLGLDLLSGGVRQVVAIGERLGVGPTSSALELCCGLGGPLRHMVERFGCRGTGVDVTERQLRIARALTEGLDIAPRLDFVQADVRELPFPDESFTHVYSVEAFIHVPDKPAAIREAFRVLAPGGPLVIRDFLVPDPATEFTLFKGTVYPLDLDDYVAAFSEAGFEDVATDDVTASNREAYSLARRMYGDGRLGLREVLAAIDLLHPGVRPPLHRFLSPVRAGHIVRYSRDRSRWARELFGTQERLDGIRQMCDEFVAAYDSGEMSLYELRGRKPGGSGL